eukprot:tig00020553_g10778.t1
MMVIPIVPSVILAVYPGPLEKPEDRRALFMYSAGLTGPMVCFSLVTWASLIFHWRLRSAREWPLVFGVPVLAYSAVFFAACGALAYGVPDSLRVAFIPPAAVSFLYVPSSYITVTVWKSVRRRRMRRLGASGNISSHSLPPPEDPVPLQAPEPEGDGGYPVPVHVLDPAVLGGRVPSSGNSTPGSPELAPEPEGYGKPSWEESAPPDKGFPPSSPLGDPEPGGVNGPLPGTVEQKLDVPGDGEGGETPAPRVPHFSTPPHPRPTPPRTHLRFEPHPFPEFAPRGAATDRPTGRPSPILLHAYPKTARAHPSSSSSWKASGRSGRYTPQPALQTEGEDGGGGGGGGGKPPAKPPPPALAVVPLPQSPPAGAQAVFPTGAGAAGRPGGPRSPLVAPLRTTVEPPPHERKHLAKDLLTWMLGLTVIIWPMWGYLFLFALFSFSSVAQVIVSLAFSIVSFSTCYAVLRIFRTFLYSLLPDHGGHALALLWLLHLLRSMRLMGSFRASSYAVLAFGVVSDAAVTFAPLLLGNISRAFTNRLGRAVSTILRPAKGRGLWPFLTGRGEKEKEERGGGLGDETRREAVRLVREGGRALFFLQALASIMASGQFVAIMTMFRYGRSRILYPFHPDILPWETYAACIVAAASSVVFLSLCLLGVRIFAKTRAARSSRRAAALEDGFELGWSMVDCFGYRIAIMWMTSTLISTATIVRTYNIFSVVFPAAFVPSDI